MVSFLWLKVMSLLLTLLVLNDVSGVRVAGCAVCARASGAPWFGRRWGHLDLLSLYL